MQSRFAVPQKLKNLLSREHQTCERSKLGGAAGEGAGAWIRAVRSPARCLAPH